MTKNVPSPLPSLVPETAPFSEEQRTWLNGFFAGLISLDNTGVTALSGDQAAALLGGAPGGAAEEDDGGAPWHDQTIPLAGAHEARRRQAAALEDDGGDGAAGLRPVRL